MRKTFLAFLLPLAICGAAFAGDGTGCSGKGVVAAHGDGEHCALAKGVTKKATMTDDGAVVMLEGKDDEAVKRVQGHLSQHEKGEGDDCPGCPFGMDDVSVKVKMTDKGGEVTFSGSTPEAVKHVQEWAKKPAGACCAGMKKAA
jgi:hypothetical protein